MQAITLEYELGEKVFFYSSNHNLIAKGYIHSIDIRQQSGKMIKRRSLSEERDEYEVVTEIKYNVFYKISKASGEFSKVFKSNDKSSKMFRDEESAVNDLLKNLGYECSIKKKA